MVDALSEFLRGAAEREVVPGHWDCGIWLADWYMVATGKPDPATFYRGIGIESPNSIRHAIQKTGLKRTRIFHRGDIGLISLAKGHLVGSIYNGWHWLVLCEGGGLGAVASEKCRFIAAWRMP